MIFITPKLDEVYQKEDAKFHLSKLLNEKSYTKANTPLTYRQINTLSKDNLFPEERNNNKGWRKFSFKELVYFYIVYELKKFGLPHEVLKSLSESFFSPPTPEIKEIEVNRYTSEIAILCVLVGAEIMLTINSKGKITYYDPPHFLLVGREDTPVIQIRLNDIVNTVNKSNKKKTIPIRWSGRSYFWNRGNVDISSKERDIIKAIRNSDYTAIRIKKTNGQASIMFAEKSLNTNQITKNEIFKLLEARDFQDIGIVKRNGNIVDLTVKESIKL